MLASRWSRVASAHGCLQFAFALMLAGCTSELGEVTAADSGATVADFVTTSCTTADVIGLSKQVAEQINCMHTGELVKFSATAHIAIEGPEVLPYLSPGAKADLIAAAATGDVVEIDSAFRTVVQQYLIYRWFEAGRCDIAAAATPGTSNHESGRAVDVANYSVWITALANHGWAHDVPGDDVHFDHLASPDLTGQDVLAFQQLWNLNNPADVIAEDGEYGPQTGARIAQSPADGFAISSGCGSGSGSDGSGSGPDAGVDGGKADGGDGSDGEAGPMHAGCAAGGGNSGAATLALLVTCAVVVRRRRATPRER